MVFLLYTFFFAFHYIVIGKRHNSLQFLQIELSFVCFFVTFLAYLFFFNVIEKKICKKTTKRVKYLVSFCVILYLLYSFLFAKIIQTKENNFYIFFLSGSLGEIGKHDRLKICSFAVIGSSPIVSNCSILLFINLLVVFLCYALFYAMPFLFGAYKRRLRIG